MSDTLRVLVVDDEPGMRSGIKRALSNYRVTFDQHNGEVVFDVSEASTGEECLSLCDSAQRPDILLLDYKLPGISGLEILDKVAAMRPLMLTIVITAYASLETAITATRKGAYDFLAKPFTPDELRHVVRKASERLLLERRAKKLAEEKKQLRFEFISIVAHELKAPLAAVEGYIRIILDQAAGSDPEAYRQMLERSYIRVQGMKKVILDLLDLTRIESGKKLRSPEKVDAVELVRSSIETLQSEAENRSISIRLQSPESILLTADRDEIEMVFNNLISNAVKYNRDGGTVDVCLRECGGNFEFCVSDTGIGIGEEDVKRLFHEFVRIKTEKTRNILGSGLGLSIVRKIVELYNGSIDIRSEPEKGTTITVRIPKNEETTVS